MRKRAAIAMSGGVDSSVAAALLKEQGYEVCGITMYFALRRSEKKNTAQHIKDARRVAHKLGIKHHVLEVRKILQEKVINDFCRQYASARTPNPCIRCNQYVKFGYLLKKALRMGAQYLVTGHYARIMQRQAVKPSGRQAYFLKKAKDLRKDQSYFLYRLNQQQLKHTLFPLGGYTKEEVRALAKKFGLPVAEKSESQEICFIPHMDYRKFLKAQRVFYKPGDILDEKGNILGKHLGIASYTIGQRQGLGIAKGYPLYVTKIEAKTNRVFLGSKTEAYKKEFLAGDIHFINRPGKKKIALAVKIRYNHKEMPAEVIFSGKSARVRFRRPQFAVTPGQSAVFYVKDTLIGGGIIEKVLD